MTRTILTLLAVALQAGILLNMAVGRETILRTGKTVWLRTAPVDPNDPMRGEYVSLSYEISNIARPMWQGKLPDIKGDRYHYMNKEKDKVIWTALDNDDGDSVYHPRNVTDQRPAPSSTKVFIKGRVNWMSEQTINARYGIEALFVEQGKGLEIERGRSRDGYAVPLEIEAALGKDGTAVLKSHRWSQLGLKMTIERDPEVAPKDRQEDMKRFANRPLRQAKIEIKNFSDKELAIVDLPAGRSFTLDPDDRMFSGEKTWEWIAPADTPSIRDVNIKKLQPGATASFALDLTDPIWSVKSPDGKTLKLSELAEWMPSLRFVYAPPPSKACARLQDAKLIWHGRLPSTAFSAMGGD